MNRSHSIIAEVLSAQDNKYFLIEELVIKFGYNGAALLGFLLNRYFYYARNDQLFEHSVYGNDWFYLKIADGERLIHLSREEQDLCLRKFKNLGLLEVKTMGLPSKRYFRLNLDKIAEIFCSQEVVASLRKTHKLSKMNVEASESEKVEKIESPPSLKPGCVKPTNLNVGNTHSLPYNNIYRDIYNNTPPNPQNGGSCVCDEPSPLTPPEKPKVIPKKQVCPKAQFGDYVKLSLEEYGSLRDKYGQGHIDQVIEEMNDYCAASRPKGYSCYAAAIRQWIRRRKEKEVMQANRPRSADERYREAQRKAYDRWKETNGNPDDDPNILSFE